MSDRRKEIWETLDAALTKFVSKAYATGQSDERERIIKLLEEDADANYYALRIIKEAANGNV
jgi:hypothetical protein